MTARAEAKNFARGEGRVWSVVSVLCVIYLIANGNIWQTRFVRDLLGQTAFRDVVVTHQEVVEWAGAPALLVEGRLTKVRGEKVFHTVQTQHTPGGPWVFARFDNSMESPGTPEDRPKLGAASAFGPWVIIPSQPDPIAARMSTRHAVPSRRAASPVYQDNVVFEVPWVSSGANQEDDQ